MALNQHIVAAVDLTDEAELVLKKAHDIAGSQKAELSVVTVIRPLNYAYAGMDMSSITRSASNFEIEAQQYARRILKEFTQPLGVPEDNLHVLFGKPSQQIKDFSEKLAADLIVMGTHGRHGLGLLLGSTANGVLHGTACNVLAVRVDSDASWLAS